MTEQTHVVVIGGGYAGVTAASRLTRRPGVAVTLVNPRPVFVDRIRLHQLVAGTHDATLDFRRVLSRRVQLVVGTAVRIDRDDRTVTLESGDRLRYDHLVLAVGSDSAPSPVPGAAAHALPVGTLEEAQRLRAALDARPADATITVVGGGPTGIEVAAELAEAGRRVRLVCGAVLGPYLHPATRPSVHRRLEALGATVLAGPHAIVAEVTNRAVHLSDGSALPSDVTIWTAGFGVPDLARASGLSIDAAGRLLTDETLTSVDDERIVAAGDAASPSDAPYRMSCQAAIQLGPQAAETVLSRIAGRTPRPVTAGFAGQCVSTGRRTGVFQVARPDDVAVPLRIGGRAGAVVKEVICRSIPAQLAAEARLPGVTVRVPGGGRARARLAGTPSDPVRA